MQGGEYPDNAERRIKLVIKVQDLKRSLQNAINANRSEFHKAGILPEKFATNGPPSIHPFAVILTILDRTRRYKAG
ncbi:MAG: hypothetical protein ACKVHE_32995 [Planctomycetales bacterium]